MKIFLSYRDDLSGVASLIEDVIRANSDIKFAVYKDNADLIVDLDFAVSVAKNTLHCVLYDHNKLLKLVSDGIYNAAKSRKIPVDYGKIDKRVKAPDIPTSYIKLGRENYDFDETSWSAAIAEGIIFAHSGKSDVQDPEKYTKPSLEKTIHDRNFAQEPTRNSDIIFGR